MTATNTIPLPRPSLPDDRLKDLDCIGFVYRLPAAEREPWFRWMSRIRLADRLAETDPDGLKMLRAFEYGDEPAHVVRHWVGYLDALADYGPGYVVKTVADCDRMLGRLSGNIVCLMPGLPERLLDAAYAFGALDQFYGNLRDLQEDAERGLCWLPEEALRAHGITREDVIAGRAQDSRGWIQLMWWWIDAHSTDLIGPVCPFVEATLPAPIDAMIDWTIDRYARIRRTLRAVDYDYRRFPAVYWAEVKRELGA